MSEKNYVVAVLLTVTAESYEAALQQADEVGESLALDAGVGVSVVHDYEHDLQGQRVVYLHPEESPDWDVEPEVSRYPRDNGD